MSHATLRPIRRSTELARLAAGIDALQQQFSRLFITERELSQIVGVHCRALQRLRKTGALTWHFRVRSAVLYFRTPTLREFERAGLRGRARSDR